MGKGLLERSGVAGNGAGQTGGIHAEFHVVSGGNAREQSAEIDLVFAQLPGPGKVEEIGDDAAEGGSFQVNAGGEGADDRRVRFRSQHLAIAGDGGERVLEFVSDAGRHLAQRGQVLAQSHLAAKGSDFGKVADQAGGAQLFAGGTQDGRDGDAQDASVAGRGGVIHLDAAEGESVPKRELDRVRQAGGSERLLSRYTCAAGAHRGWGRNRGGAAKQIPGCQPGHRRIAQDLAGGAVGVLHQAGGIEQHYPAGEIGNHGGADVFGGGGAIRSLPPQALQFVFLLFEFLYNGAVRGNRKGAGFGAHRGNRGLNQTPPQRANDQQCEYECGGCGREHNGHAQEYGIGEQVQL